MNPLFDSPIPLTGPVKINIDACAEHFGSSRISRHDSDTTTCRMYRDEPPRYKVTISMVDAERIIKDLGLEPHRGTLFPRFVLWTAPGVKPYGH